MYERIGTLAGNDKLKRPLVSLMREHLTSDPITKNVMSNLQKNRITRADIGFFSIALIIIALISFFAAFLCDFLPTVLGPAPLLAAITRSRKRTTTGRRRGQATKPKPPARPAPVAPPAPAQAPYGARLAKAISYITRAAILAAILVWMVLASSCEPEKPYAKIQREAAKERAEQMRTGEIPVPPTPSYPPSNQ